jgi:hypothetical protein
MRWRAVATLSMKFNADAGSSLPCRFQEVVFIVGLTGCARARVMSESLGLRYVLEFARCLASSAILHWCCRALDAAAVVAAPMVRLHLTKPLSILTRSRASIRDPLVH